MNVLIIGNGSIGKQHTKAVLMLGHSPVVVTHYPDKKENISYVATVDNSHDCEAAIICTATNQHWEDFFRIVNDTGIKKILIEKPIAAKSVDGIQINELAKKNKISAYVAFDMRFIPRLQYVKNNLNEIRNKIRLVKIHCGQYLPDWRPSTDYRLSYSSDITRGGGVDLDLTHEIDYMLWLFGMPDKIDFIKTYKISSLEINSPDYFKGIYDYTSFIVDVDLDYFRNLDRKLIIYGEKEVLVELDFIKNTLIYLGDKIYIESNNNLIIDEDFEFLKSGESNVLCSLDESINVLKLINR